MNEFQPGEGRLATASWGDTAAVFAEVALPTLGKGILVRRQAVVALAERLGLDTRAVRRMKAIRAKYGRGPVVFPIPGRPQAVILDPAQVRPVLAAAPQPFAPATAEKGSVIGHMAPKLSLISHPPERAGRRAFNDDVLEDGHRVHGLADGFVEVLRNEAHALLSWAGGRVRWADFNVAWARAVRRIVLGEGARDDHELTDMLLGLRSAANWGFLHPGRPRLLERYRERLQGHLARGEPGSLAARVAARTTPPGTDPASQVTQYLFAFDPAGMATFRTLAVLATHPEHRARARAEIEDASRASPDLPYLRAAVLDCLRLWPTTPAIFRETTRDVEFDGGTLAKNTHVMIFTPLFHRDPDLYPDAHRFAPDFWLQPDEAIAAMPFVPFSDGPGICPGRHLVLTAASNFIAAVLAERDIALEPARLSPDEPLPGTLDPYTLSLRLSRRTG